MRTFFPLIAVLAVSFNLVSGCAKHLPLRATEKKSFEVSEKYIFSAQDGPSYEGVGFFIMRNGSGPDLFIFSKFQDSAHDIENTRRKLMAVSRGVNRFQFPTPRPETLMMKLQYDLEVEHRIIPENELKQLAQKVRVKGERKSVSLVYYKDLTYSNDAMQFACGAIKSIDPITQTTGGSVFLFTIHFSDGTQDLSLLIGAKGEGRRDRLNSVLEQVRQCKERSMAITSKGPSFQEEIFTFDGKRSGWTSHINDISI